MQTPGVLEARALAEILDVVRTEEGAFDGRWMNPSSRALWYVPRTLYKLHRWEEFVEFVCNLDYIIEGLLEYGFLEIEDNLDTAMKYIGAQRTNTTEFLTLKQQTIDAYCARTIAAYLEFVRFNRRTLVAAPCTAFGIALATQGSVSEDARSQLQELSSLLRRYSVKLPFTETRNMVQIYRMLERAQAHGLNLCLPVVEREMFASLVDELSQVMSRMYKTVQEGNTLENCADLFLGQSSFDGIDGIRKSAQTRMAQEGFNDVALVMSGAPQSCPRSLAEASVVLTLGRSQRLSEADLIQTIAQFVSINDSQLQIVQWRGKSVVLRILDPAQMMSTKQGSQGGSEHLSSVIEVREKILKMASDPSSDLRQSGLVRGVGCRGGRWENIRVALTNTCDMDYERQYLATFVLPALRAKCRTRKIHLTWSSLGSRSTTSKLHADEGYRQALNRMNGLHLCGIRPPGSHKRPLMLSLIGSRCGETYQDVAQSHINELSYIRDPKPSSNLEWIGREEHKMYSIPYLQVFEAYLRCVDSSESFFIMRGAEWLSGPNVKERVPEVVCQQFHEQSEEMRQVVADFKNLVEGNARRQNRIISYAPSFSNFLGPKSPEDRDETPESVFQTEYQRVRTVTIVNKDFWQAMQAKGEGILQICCNFDIDKSGSISKKELRQILDRQKVISLMTDSEMVKLIAAYEVDGRGNVDYGAFINQFIGEGRIRMGGMAKLGLEAYRCLWDTIDAYFPSSVTPGKKHERDLNEQEILLDIYATTACNGVNDHIFGQLKDFAAAHDTLDVVALRGSGGSGRSTLLAAFSRHCMIELGHFTDVIYYCLQPWHGPQDIYSCLVGQLDSSIVEHAQAEVAPLSARSFGLGLTRHAESRRKDVLIIADGLLSSEMEDHISFAVRSHNAAGHHNRVRVVFGAVPAERHSASDVLSLSILPLMPTEKMELIMTQESRARIDLYPEVAAELCRKPRGGNNAKFLVVAVNFLSRLQDQEQMRVTSEMPDNVQELYTSLIFPFLEETMGQPKIQHILGLLFFEQKGGLFRTEIVKLSQLDMQEHLLYDLCESLRFLGIAAVTADEDRFIVSCEEVRTAIHDRYIARHSALKEKFQEVFKIEKTLRMLSHSKRTVTGYGLPLKEAVRAHTAHAPAQRKNLSPMQLADAAQNGDKPDRLREVNVENKNLFSLPHEILSKNSAPEEIVELRASSNAIKTIDQRIANLLNLRLLDLSVNNLEYLPEQIECLSFLEYLDVSDNGIKEVVPTVWGLESLHTLRFNRNHISHLSDELGNLTKLRELCFSRNRLLSIPAKITHLTNIEILDLSGNNLPEIPDLIPFTKLKILCLASNRLSSIPSLCKALLLEDLDLESNRLDCIPAMMSVYPNLRRINFSDNQIRYLDSHISGCSALENLNVCENKLEKFPPEFGMCSNLKTLAIANNKLKILPLELCNLHNLTTLDISSNQVEVVPGDIERLTSLQQLFLSENLLKELPIQLCSMRHVTKLEVDNNEIDCDDPVMKMKREERDNKSNSPVVRTSSLWDDHHAQMAILQHASSKQDEERIAQRKLRLGDHKAVGIDVADDAH